MALRYLVWHHQIECRIAESNMLSRKLRIGVLGLQGAVVEHMFLLQKCGVKAVVVKSAEQLESVDGLILPGGESTTIRRLLETSGMVGPLMEFYEKKKPVFGTCAGLILLAKSIVGDEENSIGIMDIKVQRNSFGRQIDSFETDLNIKNVAKSFPAVFIRAPHIVEAGSSVEILARYNNRIVMVREKHLLGCSFHPELADERITSYFVQMVEESR